MSDHRIEDLVEDSVRLVLQSPMPDIEKRPLIADLFEFQAMFDTSDTVGRVKPQLAAIGYRGEGDATGRPVLALVSAIIALADGVDGVRLIHDWLAVFSRAVHELELGENAYPRDFGAFRQSPEAITIRETALRRDVRGYKSGRGAIKMPSWNAIGSGYQKLDPTTCDRYAILRFLLDHKVDVDTIVAEYDKTLERARRAAVVVAQIREMVEAHAAFHYVGQSAGRNERTFIFEITEPGTDPSTDPEGCRFYLSLKQDSGWNLLSPQIGLRSGMMARWQGRTFDADDDALHFSRPLTALIPETELEADKGFDGIGWAWKPGQSAKLLGERINAIAGHWHHTKKFVTFYSRPSLADRLDKEGLALMASKRRERRSSVGYFANEVDMLFALACRRWDRGERPDEEIAAIHDWLRHIHPDGRFDRVEQLEKLKHGPAFPADVETMPLKRFEEPFEI